MKVVIVGGVAGGASAAARLRRLDEHAQIVMIERSGYMSYANCGLPYYVGGVIKEQKELTLQTPESFWDRFRIDVRVRQEVTAINPAEKTVTVHALDSGKVYAETYDKLILAPGAKPTVPALSGVDSERVFTLRTVEDTLRIRRFVEDRKPKTAVLAGGGFIGLEMAENLVEMGVSVTIVQRPKQLLAPLDADMASFVHTEMRRHGVALRLGETVTGFRQDGDSVLTLLEESESLHSDMVLHMDEATPHLHVDFVPVATGQSRGLSTRVSMKQALKQQGFESLGRKQTEWKAWMEREKVSLGEIAQVHDFEIISLGGGRPHMDLPEYRAAAQRLEAVQEQVAAAEQDIATLEKQKKALQGNVKLLKAVEKVKPDLEAIQPEKTLTGAVKGVTVEQVKELKAAAIRGAAAEQKVQELKEENQRLQQKIPSTKEKLKEAQERQRLENQNRKLLVQVECLEQELEQERSFSDRLLDGVSAVMDFLDRHLPEKFRPLVERARELLPVPEVQQPEQEQERGHTWGGMEL